MAVQVVLINEDHLSYIVLFVTQFAADTVNSSSQDSDKVVMLEVKYLKQHENCVLIFSGYNQRAIIAFMRTLKRLQVPFAIVAASADDRILLTDYRSHVVYVRPTTTLSFAELRATIEIVQAKLPYSSYLIAPSTEYLNRLLLKHKSAFEQMRCVIPLTDEDTYVKVSDKSSFGELCERHGIIIPPTVEWADIREYPLVAKPKHYIASDGATVLAPVILNRAAERETFSKTYDVNDFYYQSFIGGRSLYLLYYFDRAGRVSKWSQENALQQADGKSILVAACSDVHESAESLKYESLFRSLGFRGLVMVEMKEYNGAYYMIEANPRFWGPSQLFVDANVNFFEHLLVDYGYLAARDVTSDSEPRPDVCYFWFGGLVADLRSKRTLACHGDCADWSDALPGLMNHEVYRRPDTMALFIEELRS